MDPSAGLPGASGVRSFANDPHAAPPDPAEPSNPVDGNRLAEALVGRRSQESLLHLRKIPGRQAVTGDWPAWVDPTVRATWQERGIHRPWKHQTEAAEAAWNGNHVIVSTGTASGKSLSYLMPALTAAREGGCVLYLAPTKALAADQRSSIGALELPGVLAESYDGDTPGDARRWIRDHANVILTNPDMLHHGMLPRHAGWSRFIKRLCFVVIDESHHYRGVFGSHVAHVLRRLRRICAEYGARPVFIGASATTSQPGAAFSALLGLEAQAVTEDCSPQAPRTFCLWEPPLLPGGGEGAAPTRRGAVPEAADLLTDLVAQGVRTLAFVRSRRAAETVALLAREGLREIDPALADRVASYRSGYLPEERRNLERRLREGQLLGAATTNALELGIDLSGLDAVLITGWPGTRSSFWQQAGRSGRAGKESLAVLIGQDDPLDTYVVHHPEAIFDTPVEATVIDPDNPHILGPHLCAAASELPLRFDEAPLFGPMALPLLHHLVDQGLLRRRSQGWYWTDRAPATAGVNLRGDRGEPVRIVDEEEGTVLGTVDAASSHFAVHPGAVYLHQGMNYMVSLLDEQDRVALVRRDDPPYFTQARDVTEIGVLETLNRDPCGHGERTFGNVHVTNQVVSFMRRDFLTRDVLGEEALDLPPRTLSTKAVWFTLSKRLITEEGVEAADIPGALHAAEHALIGMLPLVATSDRWDVGGVSTVEHPDTGSPSIFVYDGHAGGAGFAERGFQASDRWVEATQQAILSCECEQGCPSCVQSPKCGNRNDPLDKQGAVKILGLLKANVSSERAGEERRPVPIRNPQSGEKEPGVLPG